MANSEPRMIGEFILKRVKYACFRVPGKEYYLIRVSNGKPIGCKIVSANRLTPFSNALSEWFDKEHSKLPSYSRINAEITAFLKVELERESLVDRRKADHRKITRLLNKYLEEYGENSLRLIKEFKVTKK